MTVKSDTLYVQLDSWNLTIEAVNLIPEGAALNATLHAGNVPVNQTTPLIWDVKNPNPALGSVLVVELDKLYTTG